MPVTVLHLVHCLTAGGAERVLVNLINGSTDDLHHIVCSFNPADDFQYEIIENKRHIINLNKRQGNDLTLAYKIAAICQKYSVDIVHAQGWATYVEGVIGAKLLCFKKIKFFFAFRGKTIDDVAGIPRKRVYAQRVFSWLCDGIITPSENMRQDYAETFGVKINKIKVIHNGIDTSRFHINSLDGIRNEIKIAEKSVVIGCVARMDPVKNLIWLIRALAPLLMQEDDLYLLLVGDGPDYKNIKIELNTLKLENKVILTGRRRDVEACFRSMNLYVQPSLYEGISNTVLEAMASSLAVVATNVGGTSEIVTDGVTGFLVDSKVDRMIYDAVAKLVSKSNLRIKMGVAGREFVEKNLTIDRMVSAYERLFVGEGN